MQSMVEGKGGGPGDEREKLHYEASYPSTTLRVVPLPMLRMRRI